MSTKNSNSAVQPQAQPCAQFSRIVVLDGTTSVSIDSAYREQALRLTGGDYSRVANAIREAASQVERLDRKTPRKSDANEDPAVSEKRTQTFSARVRAKALAKLRGAYRPFATGGVVVSPPSVYVGPLPANVDAAMERLAVENNKAWGL